MENKSYAVRENSDIFVSKRLRLATLCQKDASLIYTLRSNPVIVKYTDVPLYTDKRQAEEYISLRDRDLEEGKCFMWVASLLESGEKVGSVCLFNFDKRHDQAEIGYDLLVEHWHKGYAAEMVKCVLDFGFKELKKEYIFAHLHVENIASVKLLEKLGFALTGEKEDGLSLMLLKNPDRF